MLFLTHFQHKKGSNKSTLARIMTFCIDFILCFDYFEGVSEKSWVLTILKGSKIKLFCLWMDLVDFYLNVP